MDALEEFLMHQDEELDILPENVPITLNDMIQNCNLDDWWNAEFPNASEFEFEMLTIMRVEEDQEDQVVFQQEQPVGDMKYEEEKGQQEQLQAPMHEERQREVDEDVEEDEGHDHIVSDHEKKSDEASSKNLLSERNRRKRLNQQLFTLRSLVPNITKMDKRSILVDALAYLRSLLEDIEKETENHSSQASSETSSSIVAPDDSPLPVPAVRLTIPYERCAAHPAITQMNAQMLQDATFVLEIGCNKAIGAVCQVQRSIEMLGVKITCSSVNGLNHESMITTAFVRVKKKSLVTPERLLNQLKLNARQLGLYLPSGSA